ncbi:peptidase [Streptomyces sp. N2-109]|uniref:Peptidase n=1 Tax=Streptomyces gossypii TaxID=2883101 RepID=A0ABT2K1H6_9ACTN|nr:Clp protease N-terminal domain-containing protein [Streptomyces gossypii]MCT2594032.1 peptidase [Streptomyces gossypii]
MVAVIATARRRAARDTDKQIDTAHLLHSLLECDSEVCRLLDGGSPQTGRLLGYLVQRSIGYGLRWQGTVEDSGALPAVEEDGVPGWSPAAVTAMEYALVRSRGRRAARAEGIDLFAGLVRDGECRAVEVLRRVGVDVERLAHRLEDRCEKDDTPVGA